MCMTLSIQEIGLQNGVENKGKRRAGALLFYVQELFNVQKLYNSCTKVVHCTRVVLKLYKSCTRVVRIKKTLFFEKTGQK